MDYQTFGTKPSNPYVGATMDFFKSESILAKLAFLFLVLVVFMILLQLGTNLLAWYFMPSNSPQLIDGTVDGKTVTIIAQNPKAPGAVPITRSINQDPGLTFTWSVWVFLTDVTNYNPGKYGTIFFKGNDNIDSTTGLNSPNNCPGLYIAPNTNTLVLKMDTFSVIGEEMQIPNVPMNKWFLVNIRTEGKTVDVYINAVLAKSEELTGVVKQNYGDVHVGGFSGYLSNLWYYNHALNILEINSLVNKGPDTTMKQSTGLNIKAPNYLSMHWYFGEQGAGPLDDSGT